MAEPVTAEDLLRACIVKVLDGWHDGNRERKADEILAALKSLALKQDRVDATRYRRLQVLGCAPGTSPQIDRGRVLRASSLDSFIDRDILLYPERGDRPPSKQEVAGASEGETSAQIERLCEERNQLNHSFGHGPFAAGRVREGIAKIDDEIRALKNTGETGMPQQELPQASYDYQSSAKIGAGAPCPDCGTPYGWKHEDGCSVMARNLANIQRLGQEFDDDGLKAQVRPLSETLSVGDVIQREIDKSKVSASDLSETESVGAKFPGNPALEEALKKAVAAFEAMTAEEQEEHLRKQRESWARGEAALAKIERAESRCVGSPSQQGDADVHAQIQALIARWHRGDHVESVECEAVLREAAAALKTLKDGRDAATTALNAAMQGGLLCPISERDSLSKRVKRMEGELRQLLKTAKLLKQNAEGCAVNHYAGDFAIQGLPGWIGDCANSISRADAALAEEGT